MHALFLLFVPVISPLFWSPVTLASNDFYKCIINLIFIYCNLIVATGTGCQWTFSIHLYLLDVIVCTYLSVCMYAVKQINKSNTGQLENLMNSHFPCILHNTKHSISTHNLYSTLCNKRKRPFNCSIRCHPKFCSNITIVTIINCWLQHNICSIQSSIEEFNCLGGQTQKLQLFTLSQTSQTWDMLQFTAECRTELSNGYF